MEVAILDAIAEDVPSSKTTPNVAFRALHGGVQHTQGKLVGAIFFAFLTIFFARIFSRPFRLFPAPTNCLWFSDDGFKPTFCGCG